MGDRFSDLANTVTLKGFTKVDLGLKLKSPWGMFGQIHADNLFDSHGLTEGDPRSATAANGRPILGRSIRFSIGYAFQIELKYKIWSMGNYSGGLWAANQG